MPVVALVTIEPLAVQDLLDALEAATCAVRSDGVIVAVNTRWRSFMVDNDGHPPTCGVGANYLSACDQAAEDLRPGDAVDATNVASGLRSVLSGETTSHAREYPCHSPEEERWFDVRIAPVQTSTGPGALVSHADITDLRRTQQALSHQVLHDALTGLPNRVLLLDRLGQALADSRRQGTHVAVGFLDLDHFKRVNDSLGHAVGDALLVAVAARLSEQVREGDTLARYAGDEFVVVWRDLRSGQDAEALSQRLGGHLAEPFEIGPHVLEVSASVGIAVAQSGAGEDEVLLAADAAMYDAKRHGRGRVRVFTNELRSGAHERAATEAALRNALERDELVLHYQPVVELSTGRVVAVEALARWQHPDLGLVGPDHFIAVAEASGLILPLGRWALRQACQDAADFPGTAAGLDVAVNLSPRQLIQPDVLGHVREALSNSRLDPHRLLLEVTESAVVEDEQAAAVALDELSALGVRLAIDDFGTGWSSLLYLRRYPISVLKLDRAFVSGVGTSRDDEAICASVISLAKAVGATSIGEGVETMEQYAALRSYGCEQAQGYLWSRAVPVHELPAALTACADVPVVKVSPRPNEATSPGTLAVHVLQTMRGLHRSGASLHTIAGALNSEQAPNPTGLRWTAAAVARHLAA